jgi:23S rRNA (uracil1939-C5)-methyltransferase
MTRGDRITIAVEKPAAGGRMIARHDGAIVLVSATIPGETVEAEIEKIQRGTVWAKTTRVVVASPDRVEAGPDWSCGGNVFAHIQYERQLALKQAIIIDALTRIGHLAPPEDLPIAGSRVDGYRMRARLHLRQGQLGFFREGTHTLCDPAHTRQLLPQTVETLQRLQGVLTRMPPGAITDVEISENCAATERACHLELAEGTDPSRLGSLPHVDGIIGMSSAAANNPHTLELWGTPSVHDEIAIPNGNSAFNVNLSRRARSFFQGNRYLLADLVAAVVGAVPAGRVLDLYAGVGLFAVAVAVRHGTDVVAVEGDRSSADDLKDNAARANASVHARHQSVETFLSVESTVRATTVIIDPPRTGVSRDALSGVIRISAPRVIYVSCDVATLARDARLLVDAGYDLKSLRLFDLFPNTAHVESLAVFEK